MPDGAISSGFVLVVVVSARNVGIVGRVDGVGGPIRVDPTLTILVAAHGLHLSTSACSMRRITQKADIYQYWNPLSSDFTEIAVKCIISSWT